MSKLPRLVTVLVLAALCAGPLSAGIVWQWSFQTESGTFVTTGAMADLASPQNLQIVSFSVTSSTLPSNVGALFVAADPANGLLWDGTQITQFYRASGGLTNGSNFVDSATGARYTLAVAGGIIGGLFDADENDIVGFTTAIVTPVANENVIAVPTLSTAAMVALVTLLGAAAAFLLRRGGTTAG
jgi:hypothetical protein